MTSEELNQTFPMGGTSDNKSDEGWTKVSEFGEDWDFEKNPILVGLYVRRKEGVGKNKSVVYTIEDRNTKKSYNVWGSTILDSKMELINPGMEVKIEFTGMGDSDKAVKPYKKFEVFAREVPMQRV